jgi:hypothetical protein
MFAMGATGPSPYRFVNRRTGAITLVLLTLSVSLRVAAERSAGSVGPRDPRPGVESGRVPRPRYRPGRYTAA